MLDTLAVTSSHRPSSSEAGENVIPHAATDSRFVRAGGVIACGFTSAVTSLEEMQTVHGVNERLSVENVHQGTWNLFEIVTRFFGGHHG